MGGHESGSGEPDEGQQSGLSSTKASTGFIRSPSKVASTRSLARYWSASGAFVSIVQRITEESVADRLHLSRSRAQKNSGYDLFSAGPDRKPEIEDDD